MPRAFSASAEEKLRILEQAFAQVRVGVTLVDTDGKILYSNPADTALHGYEVDELLGQNVSIFARASDRRPLSGDQLRGLDNWKRETVNVRKDGTEFVVEITSDVVKGESGEPIGIVSTCLDITERQVADLALKESRERFELAVQGSNDGIWDWNLLEDTVYYSPRWLEMVGVVDDKLGDKIEDWIQLVHEDDALSLRRQMDEYLAGEAVRFEHEHRLLRPDGTYRWMRARGQALWDDDRKPVRIAGSLTDITDLKVLDPLTGLPNRASLMDRLAHALARGKRRSAPAFAFLFLDVDRFKNVNDSLGHLVGDELLVGVSRRLLTCLRASDTLARYGGDEFAILLEDLTSREDALIVAERIHAKFTRPLAVAQKELYVTVSMGLVFHRDETQKPEDLLRDADLAMYRAKALGRGRHSVFEDEMREEANALLEVENDLRRALDRSEGIRLEYQPIYDLELGRLYGFEALVRWEHPDRGTVMPNDFMPMAEETGLVITLGRLVLHQACRQMMSWRKELEHASELYLAVNLSARQLLEPDLLQEVRDELAQSGLDAESLLLEITETSLLEHTESVVETIKGLREMGVRVCIDDFGTGYSSLRYLQQYPVDMLKIDGSFIQQLGPNGEGTELVKTLLSLGADLNMQVIAEGIEGKSQLSALRELDCRFGQGFELSRPLAPAFAEELIGASQRETADELHESCGLKLSRLS